MNGTLCIGYDVESGVRSITAKFLKTMKALHEKHDSPCSLFITGKSMEKNADLFKPFIGHSLFDCEQHTYSHLIFKQFNQIVDGHIQSTGNNEPIEKIREEVQKASEIYQKVFGNKPIGITTPYAFYQGLQDRPDILRVLYEIGIRFIRSYGRNEFGYNPVPFEIQPYFYSTQGFPDFLECPVQGWQDCIWRDRFGWKANWEKQVFLYLDEIVAKKQYYGLVQHDWSSIKEDRSMRRTEEIIIYAQRKNVQIIHYKEYYLKEQAKK